MFYYSQFKANKNTQKQHVANVKYTRPTTRNTSGAPAKVAYQVRTGPMTRVTQGAQDIQMFLHDAAYYSSVTTEEEGSQIQTFVSSTRAASFSLHKART